MSEFVFSNNLIGGFLGAVGVFGMLSSKVHPAFQDIFGLAIPILMYDS